MTTTLETPSPASDTLEFPGLEETGKALSALAERPPSPMPLPTTAPSSASSDTVRAPGNPARSVAGLKDYKGREFDPRLHKVKANGEPELTAEGKLKLLPPSKRGGIVDSVRNFFAPKSDHELTAEQEEEARVQARSIAEVEDMEASAEFLKNGYFMVGEMLAGPGFYTDFEKREEVIRRHFMVYEKATGKAYNPPPWLVLLAGLGWDFKKTVSTVPECKEALGELGSGIVGSVVQGSLQKTFLGRTTARVLGFFGVGKKKAAKGAEPAKQPKEFQPKPQFPEMEE